MKALVCAIFASVVLIAGIDGPSQASASSLYGQFKSGGFHGHSPAWAKSGGGHFRSPAWGKARPVWWGGARWGWGPGYWGAGFWWGPRPWRGPIWWGYPAYPYSYYPYAYPPPVVQPSPPVYVQPAPVEAQPAQPAQQPQYWYYCEESRTYYPYVRECPAGWMTVVPQSSSPSPSP
jgi:hypothetical protein